MPMPRKDVFKYYLKSQSPTIKLAAKEIDETIERIDQLYRFNGSQKALSAVVRCDLNGYSDWCRKHELDDRIPLLDHFFLHTLLSAQRLGGVYYRDEGDCVVLLFSDYFGSTDSLDQVRAFARSVSREVYGKDKLTAKTTVSAGEVVYYQKAHEQGTEEWSADGDPFIFAARMENEAESKQIVHFRKEDFDEHFAESTSPDSGDWVTEEQSARIPGLWQPGGHQMLVKDIFKPPAKEDGDDGKDFTKLLTDVKSPSPFEKQGGGKYA